MHSDDKGVSRTDPRMSLYHAADSLSSARSHAAYPSVRNDRDKGLLSRPWHMICTPFAYIRSILLQEEKQVGVCDQRQHGQTGLSLLPVARLRTNTWTKAPNSRKEFEGW
jgi:hypothetical protein